jgi:hypothetical protein
MIGNNWKLFCELGNENRFDWNGYVTKRNEERRSPTYGVLLAVECDDGSWQSAKETEGMRRKLMEYNWKPKSELWNQGKLLPSAVGAWL